MRIAYLVSQYPSLTHTFVLREIVGLREHGLDVRALAIRGDDRAPERQTRIEREEAAKVATVLPINLRFLAAHFATLLSRPVGYFGGIWLALRLSRWNIRAAPLHFIYFLEAVVAGWYIKRLGASHVHTHFASTVALLAQRVYGFTWSWTVHGPAEFDDVVGSSMREKVAAAQLVVCISDFARSQVMRASDPADWHKLLVCRLGVDPSWFEPRTPRAGGSTISIVSVGRLAPIKAQRLLVRAAASLTKAGRLLSVSIVGAGSEREPLQREIDRLEVGASVRLVGALNQVELRELYRQADIFALPSFAEGVPVVLMEAMAMGVPCVATCINGIPELIEHGTSGVLVRPANLESFTAALDRLVTSEELRTQIGAAARRQIETHYDLRQNVADLAVILKRVAGDRGAQTHVPQV